MATGRHTAALLLAVTWARCLKICKSICFSFFLMKYNMYFMSHLTRSLKNCPERRLSALTAPITFLGQEATLPEPGCCGARQNPSKALHGHPLSDALDECPPSPTSATHQDLRDSFKRIPIPDHLSRHLWVGPRHQHFPKQPDSMCSRD